MIRKLGTLGNIQLSQKVGMAHCHFTSLIIHCIILILILAQVRGEIAGKAI